MILNRVYYHDRTEGQLQLNDGKVLYTIEPPQEVERNGKRERNVRNKTCIPEGNYELRKLERSASGKYKKVYWVTGVEGRSGILIHNGNTVKHTRGCIIIGLKSGVLAGRPAVLNSRSAKALLWASSPTALRIVGTTTPAEAPDLKPKRRTFIQALKDFINYWKAKATGAPERTAGRF